MALVKFGGGIIKMSGSIAGNVFARNRSGDYVRSWKKPINPQSPAQGLIRSALAFLADRWHSALTAVQRQAWNLYAGNVAMKNALGETTYLSGYNHYIRSNSILKMLALTLVDAGPTVNNLPEQDPVLAITPTAADNLFSIAFDDTLEWCDEDGGFLFLFQGMPQGEHVNFFDGPWRYMATIEGDGITAPTSPEAAVPSVLTFGYNQRLWVYGRILRADGRLSEPFRCDELTGNAP